jgi:hypothetical protein
MLVDELTRRRWDIGAAQKMMKNVAKVTRAKSGDRGQGDRMGWILAHWAIAFFEQFLLSEARP